MAFTVDEHMLYEQSESLKSYTMAISKDKCKSDVNVSPGTQIQVHKIHKHTLTTLTCTYQDWSVYWSVQ